MEGVRAPPPRAPGPAGFVYLRHSLRSGGSSAPRGGHCALALTQERKKFDTLSCIYSKGHNPVGIHVASTARRCRPSCPGTASTEGS